uniref:DNA-directed RNA polymerase subunit n=1 Tax=Cryptoglena skujai TaxID=161229 RepID=A0A0G3SGQ9_9EUGL|nr:RNA polymerase beta' subunit [Cryptoglena skujai]AKL39005.1 RNA polymerase beta' subunit [Cryptoglena skujai]
MIKEYFQTKIASPEKILTWTERLLPNGKLIGEITKSESINHETFKPIADGLFCEKIFGPTNDWECLCKRYKKIQRRSLEKNAIIICPRCNVEINLSKIRNYRMGYIKLSSAVIHSWYLKNTPNYISITLNKSKKETNKIVYNKSFIQIKKAKGKNSWITGGEAVNILLKNIDLYKTCEKIKFKKRKEIEKEIKELKKPNNVIEKKIIINKNRIKILNHFLTNKVSPHWMTIKFLPVLPPNIRPIVRLKDKTIITTDLNFLYAKIIDINNKINKLRKMSVPENFLNNEKLLLQENVDKLINSETSKNNKYTTTKSLKSLSKNIQGKRGRFRENLLGKTVDYSARSVIIVEPKLRLNECGLPLQIITELFQPIILKKLIELKKINTIREGKNLIKLNRPIIYQIIEKIIKNYPILLNRAPTLHRLGIQSFQIVITKSKAIQLHPLVCSAFNADFDGDQMGIHIPLSLKAIAEARTLMISSNNCTSPATGLTNIIPSQDMILGCYFLTIENTSLYNILKNIKCFNNIEKIFLEYKLNLINIHSYIWICDIDKKKNTNIIKLQKNKNNKLTTNINLKRTTVGRIIFNKVISELL